MSPELIDPAPLRTRYQASTLDPHALRRSLDRWGFAIISDFTDPGTVTGLLTEIDALRTDVERGTAQDRHVDAIAPVVRSERGSFHHRLNYVTERCPTAATVGQDLLALMSSIGLPDWRLLDAAMNGVVYQEKRQGPIHASGYRRIRWHIDFPEGHQLSPVVTAGLYTHDSYRSNGCLLVVPLSHVRPTEHRTVMPVEVEVQAGDVVLHHEHLLHTSAPMAVEGRRGTLYYYFFGGREPERYASFADDDRLTDVQGLFR